MKLATLAILLLALTACPPEPHYAPVLDGGPEPAAAVCDHLATLGCAEGLDPFCAPVIRRVMHDGLTAFSASCVLAATTKSEIRNCPAVSCP